MTELPGWIVSLKRWQCPLYVRAEAPNGMVAWTGDRAEAMRFPRKNAAFDFLVRMREKPEECDIKFTRGSQSTSKSDGVKP